MQIISSTSSNDSFAPHFRTAGKENPVISFRFSSDVLKAIPQKTYKLFFHYMSHRAVTKL